MQPPNSPHFNVLDLGFFNSIQSLQHKAAPGDIDDLVIAVERAYEELSYEKLENVFLSLQKVMESTMLRKGSNGYALSHMKKATLRHRGTLPIAFECNEEAVEACNRILEG